MTDAGDAGKDSPPGYLADAPSPPSVADVSAALHDFLELADRCLTTRDRGFTPATRHDYRAFVAIAESLKKATVTEPLHRSPKGHQKQAKYTTEQLDLGQLRERFDWICNCAARQPMTASRDKKLASLLYAECELRSSLGMTEAIVTDAVAAVRDRRSHLDRPDDDPDGEPDLHDWLLPRTDEDATEGSKDRRQQANDAAGDILEEIVRRCPVALSCGVSRSSTSEYARRFRLNFDAITARVVTDNERLTLLAVLLGARFHEAPWIAFRLRLLVSGRDVDELAGPDWEDDWALREPDQFRLPGIEEWRAMRDAFLKNFLSAGRPPAVKTAVTAYRIFASHLRRATRYAGREIPPKEDFLRLWDPFDEQRTEETWGELGHERVKEPRYDVPPDPLEVLAGVIDDLPVTLQPTYLSPGFGRLLELAERQLADAGVKGPQGAPPSGTKRSEP